MRYLNRVIFINSAHIPLAEVNLDGNIHFIGTQGVGKSTLLRAILFFYNADKLRLGIPKEKSSFDSYYFPNSNSYIIYEVMRENGAYSIIASKSQGRVLFRFVDAPYERAWFIDDTNQVSSDWSRIRERIGTKHSISPQVTSYEQYRDIIFGNNKKQELVQFRKYAIVESTKYQNIPRTIQNVFLNTKLDANFIKETIIRSMSDDEVAIDLDFYRNQIKSFEQEYNDVMLWFNKNSKGEVRIRKLADIVINNYRDLLYTKNQISQSNEELNYAARVAEESIPILGNTISDLQQEKSKIKAILDELSGKYNKERDDLNSQLGIAKDMIKKIRDKKKWYDQINISEVVARVEKEDQLIEQERNLQKLKSTITSAFNDLEQKYSRLIEQIESDFKRLELEIKNEIVNRSSNSSAQKEEIRKIQDTQLDSIRDSYQEKIKGIEDKRTEIVIAQEKAKNKVRNLQFEQPFKKQREEISFEITSLERQKGELDLEIEKTKSIVNQIRSEFESKKKELDWEYERSIKLIKDERNTIRVSQDQICNLIEQRSGSLCEWLDKNSTNWKETIGKIADEEIILYSRNLNPKLTSDSSSIFGIDLDLSQIERNIRTPEDLLIEKQELQERIDKLTANIDRLSSELATKTSELEKHYSSKIREANNELHTKERELEQIPNKLKHQKADLAQIDSKEKLWREEQLKAIEDEQNELAHKRAEIENSRNAINSDRDKRLEGCRKKCGEQIKRIEQDDKLFKTQKDGEITAAKSKLEIELETLNNNKRKELQGEGADVETIGRYEREIQTIQKELKYIKDNRSKVSDFNKDQRELFDKESETREYEKSLKTKLEDLNDKYTERKQREETRLRDKNSLLANFIKELEMLESGLKDQREFLASDMFNPLEHKSSRERATKKSCHIIVEELKRLIFSTNTKMEEFKKSVNNFNGNFSSKNTFHFKVDIFTPEQLFDFASNLCEFIDNDKITEYQKRISERYIDIIRRISKEVSNLMRHESEIIKTIKEINSDFNKRNFAGVIKEIALQSDSSSDKVVQLLIEINRFNQENEFNMGEADLFTQADSSLDETNQKAIKFLLAFMKHLLDDPSRKQVNLSDSFHLKFRVKENDNDTGWIEKIANVGSEGTDILVKAMVNIMLINVFKEKASRKFGEFRIHCMMDEIGKLHPTNVKGILEFANSRNILLINSSPTTYNAADYRHTYLLSKDGSSNTMVTALLTNKAR
ncbi:MAG: ATP-binding protein [Bacteroidales bacterium]